MKIHARIRIVSAVAVMLCCVMLPGRGLAQFQLVDKIKYHIESDPLTFSAHMGTTFQSIYNNSDVYAAASPFAVTTFADLCVGIYGFKIPIHIDLMNIASTHFSFPSPEVNINIIPEYKDFRLHLGTSSMNFSKYTYSGLNFTGVGAEYNGKVFHAATFYGIMQAATRIKEFDNRTAIQYMADSLLGLNVEESDLPQYRRMGYGAKIGVGNNKNYFDISLFKAKDDTTSLPATWHSAGTGDLTYRDSLIVGKENLAVGVSGRVSAGKWASLTANVGATLFTPDLTSTAINREKLTELGVDVSDEQLKKALGILEKTTWLYEPRMNTRLRFAGDASATLSFIKNVKTVLTYRFVQADYASLGANRFSQNTHGAGVNTNIQLFKKTTTLVLSGFLQRDNLDHKQIYTNQVITYSANVTSSLPADIDLAISYSGVKQDQFNGTRQVNDSTRNNQLAHNLTVSPSYTIDGDNSHNISLEFNMVQTQNLNKLKSSDNDVGTYTAGLGYLMSLSGIRMDVGVNYDYSVSFSKINSYNSHTFGFVFGYTVVKTDKISLKANYSMSLSFNDNEDDFEGVYDPDDPEATAKTSTLSFSNRLGMAFSYRQRHNAQIYLSSSNYSENIVIGQKITTDFDLRINFAYSYMFAKRIIKSKRQKDVEPDTPTLDD